MLLMNGVSLIINLTTATQPFRSTVNRYDMRKQNFKNEPIYFFRSERNSRNGFYNPSKFFVEVVSQISYRDINIVPFVGVVDDAGHKIDLTAKEIRDFEKGKTSRLVIEWDTIYDTSFYIRESALTEEEKEMFGFFNEVL